MRRPDAQTQIPVGPSRPEERVPGGMPAAVGARADGDGQSAIERARQRRPQADESAPVALRLRLDQLDHRLDLDRGPLVQQVQNARACNDAPPIAGASPVVCPVPCAQGHCDVGRPGEAQVHMCPRAEAAIVGIVGEPAPADAHAAGHAARIEQAGDSNVAGRCRVVPVGPLLALCGGGCREHSSQVLRDGRRERDAGPSTLRLILRTILATTPTMSLLPHHPSKQAGLPR